MTQLCQRQGAFEEANSEVVLISFSSHGEYAADWQKNACPSFRLLLDPDRDVYRAYGLARSYLRSWNLRTILRYVSLLRLGRRWRGIEDDSAQLGGDFIIDAQGILRLAHRSRDPVDRPPAADLLAKLRDIAAARNQGRPG